MELYKVLKVCKLLKNKKKEGFIFKDKDGKIYFPAKVEKETVKDLEVGKRYLIWVIKEEKNFGYCRTNINGILIRDHIDKLPEYSKDHYLTCELTRDIIRFSNDMCNHDLPYHDRQLEIKLEEMKEIESKYPAVKYINDYVENMGIGSEDLEFRYELAEMDAYLHYLFNVIKFKQ